MDKKRLDLYTDYLISSFSETTATGMSRMLDGELSHDQITRFLSKREYNSKDLWLLVKKDIRRIQSPEEGCIIFDDTIQEKEYTDESELICWHYDHCKKRNMKGVNILNCLLSSQGVDIPIAFETVLKPVLYSDIKTRKVRRKSTITKNEQLRSMLSTCHHNQVQYRYVLMDSWFSSKENLEFIHQEMGKIFMAALPSNRNASISLEEKKKGCYTRIDQLEIPENKVLTVWLKGIDFPVSLVKQVFINKDGSTGTLYLVCNDLSLTYLEITTIYKKRWKVEVFHKSIKSNAGLAKSPTRTVITQNNHFFASIYAYAKMEILTCATKTNHFALKTKIYMKAIKTAFGELREIQKSHNLLKTA